MITKYILVEWPESQYFMEYIGTDEAYYQEGTSNIFVSERLYRKYLYI